MIDNDSKRVNKITQQTIALATSLTIDEIKTLSFNYNKLLETRRRKADKLDYDITDFLNTYSEAMCDNYLDVLENMALDIEESSVPVNVIKNIKNIAQKLINSVVDKEKYFYEELGQEAELLIKKDPSFSDMRFEKTTKDIRLDSIDAGQSMMTQILDDFIGSDNSLVLGHKLHEESLDNSYVGKVSNLCNSFLEQIDVITDLMEKNQDSIIACEVAIKLIERNQSVDAILSLKYKDIYNYVLEVASNKIVKLIEMGVEY